MNWNCLIRIAGSFAAAMLLASCASQKSLSSLGTGYQTANQAAVDVVSTESSQVKKVRRVGAVVAYLNNPKLQINDNLNADQIPGSFINFVCTGADDFEITSAGLQYTAQYAKTVKAITTAPDNSLSGYLDALSGLKGKDKPLELPIIKTKQFDECRDAVAKDVPPIGITAVSAHKEAIVGPIAAIAAVQTLITSVQTLLTSGAKALTEAEQRAMLKSFITNNQNNYKQVLSDDLSADELQTAFTRRRQIAVAAPFFEFEEMMKLSITINRSEMIKRALQINQDLAEYDALRIQKPPALVVSQFKQINQKLEDYADGKETLADMIQFLSETASELQTSMKDYNDVLKAIPPAESSLGIK